MQILLSEQNVLTEVEYTYPYLSCEKYTLKWYQNLHVTYFEGGLLDSSLHTLQIQHFRLLIFLEKCSIYSV